MNKRRRKEAEGTAGTDYTTNNSKIVEDDLDMYEWGITPEELEMVIRKPKRRKNYSR